MEDAADTRYVVRHHKGGGYWYWQRRGFPLVRLPDDESERRARATTLNANADKKKLHIAAGRRATMTSTIGIDEAYWRTFFMTCRTVASRRGLSFGLTPDDLTSLVERSQGACEVSGIPFSLDRAALNKAKVNPWAPSLDRIDCAAGYAVGNVRLVCTAVNLALRDWGLPVLERIAISLVAKRRL